MQEVDRQSLDARNPTLQSQPWSATPGTPQQASRLVQDPVQDPEPAEDAAEFRDRDFEEQNFEDQEPSPFHFTELVRRRLAAFLAVVLAIVVMAVVPPLINVSRYQRQIASSISASLGRPVRIGSVTLNLLPMPGFDLHDFIVEEDPAFGAEPVIRAAGVRVTLRMNSLWRRRVEFSTIALDSPSVNLVHLPTGQWNLESILLQASRMPAAPTAQKAAGDAPRFPYIEATAARLNVKFGLEKLPFSLTDAEFALWLPEPHQWHLRLKAHPTRTDGPAMETGTLRAEGTLEQAPTLAAVPVNLQGEWSAAPLGAVSRILTGADVGLRGEMTLTAAVRGSMSDNAILATLTLRQLRRADFVPPQLLGADLSCTAHATVLFHTLEQLRCTAPPAASSANISGLRLTGQVPDILHPASAMLEAKLSAIPAARLLDLLRAVSPRVSPGLTATGTLDGTIFCCTPQPEAQRPFQRVSPPAASPTEPALRGEFAASALRVALDGSPAFLDSDVTLHLGDTHLAAGPFPLNLGARDPALAALQADTAGYTIHLSGPILPSRAATLAQTLPPAGSGLPEVLGVPRPQGADTQSAPPEQPVRVDLISTHPWGQPQTWHPAAEPHTGPARTPHHRRRR